MISSRKEVPELDIELLSTSPLPLFSSNACADISPMIWSGGIGVPDVANEQEGEEPAKCFLRSFYRSAFDFPDLSSSLRDSAPETVSRASCLGHSTSPIIGSGSSMHAIANLSTTSLSVYNDATRNAVPVHGVRLVASDNASPCTATNVTTGLREGPVFKRIDRNGDNTVAAAANRELVHPGLHAQHAATTTTHQRVMPADDASNNTNRRAVGITHSIGAGILQADGATSSAYAFVATSSLSRQPPPLPRYQGVLKFSNTLQQQHPHLHHHLHHHHHHHHHHQGHSNNVNNLNMSQGPSPNFKASRSDHTNSRKSSSQKNSSYTVSGHKAENGAMLSTSPHHPQSILVPSPRQIPFEIDASTPDTRQGDLIPVSGSRKISNVHISLQDAVRYVPYVSGAPLEGSFSLLEGSAMMNTSSTSTWSFSLNMIKREWDKHQLVPVFIQMFPCELRDRTIIVLNRVVEATCGADIATVVGIEPRSETSFIALVRTNEVWLLIHKLRCRVLMDRHGFWYAENMEQYLRLKEYCEGVRRLPQQMRHFQTDGLPCMPLVVELSRSVNAAAVTSPPAAPSFDEMAPIVTVERHVRSGTATGSNDGEGSPLGEASGSI